MYANSRGPGDWRDRGSVAEWAARIKEHPAGFKAWKMSFVPLYGSVIPAGNRPRQERAMTLRPSEIRGIARYYETVREALDSSFDLMIHCHNEYDLPSMLMLAKALEPVAPMWLEDPLPIPYFDGWKQLTSRSSVPILTGEKLELASEFLPFFANQAVDIVQPDLVYAGGFTGCWQIAELADLYSVPLTMHNVGTVVHNVANAHFAAATRNFVMSETRMGNNRPVLEELVEEEIVIRDGLLPVPDGPGLGITVSEEALKANRADGEPWWDE
jgi:L-alanine-DL-glutamate epimerase-like enolase superfamily enzyme